MKLENISLEGVNSLGEIENLDVEEVLARNPKTLLFFYPKDNTPGCTNENTDFSHLKADFNALGIELIGISKDSSESHKKFIEKYSLKNTLISDPDLILHKEFGAYGEKNNYGKIVQGVIRSTFLLDSSGTILKEWKNVRAKGHAQRILRELSDK